MEKLHFEITWASLWRIFAFALAIIALYLIKDVLILLALAVVISAICNPFVDYLQGKKVSRFLGTFFVFSVILMILLICLWLVVPLVISQFGHFITNFNGTISQIGNHGFLTDLIQQFILNLKAAFDVLANGATAAFNLIFSIFGGIFLALTCLVLSFYLTLEEKGIERFFRAIIPKNYEDWIIPILDKSAARIGRWFQGRIISSVILGLLTWLGLYLLGIDYSGTLALLTAILSNVPLVGPLFSGSVACLVALTDSWLLAFWVAIFFILIHELESALITPLLMKKIAGLPPLVVLVALLIGAKIAGLLGFLLAVPAAIILQEVFIEKGKRKTQI